MKFTSGAAAIFCAILGTSAIAAGGMAREPLCGTPPFALSFKNSMTVSVFASHVKCKDRNNYVFDFGDGSPKSEPTLALVTVTHTYEKPGTYKVQAYILLNDGSLARHAGETIEVSDK